MQRQLSVMDACGIEKALLLYPTSDAHLRMGWDQLCAVYNQNIADIVQKYPGRFIGGGIVPAGLPKQIPQELKRIKDLGLKVISMASSYDKIYLDDERFACVFEFAQSQRMPIHVHSQIIDPIGEERLKDPLLSPVLEYVFDVSVCIGRLMMSEILPKYPDVKLIFAHYGGVLPLVKERFDSTYMMLRKREFVKDLKKTPSEFFKNLYFDTSGSKSLASLLCALEVTDSSHILFGSDFPANQGTTDSIRTIQDSSLSDGDKKNILENNLLKLL